MTTLVLSQSRQVKNTMFRSQRFSRKGDGIARIQGFVIFVKDGKVGQNAKIRVTSSRKQICHRRNSRWCFNRYDNYGTDNKLNTALAVEPLFFNFIL